MGRLVTPAIKHVKHVPEDGEYHQVGGQTVEIPKGNTVGNNELKVLHVAVGVRRGGVVIEHQQNAGDKKEDEQQRGDRPQIVRGSHPERLLAHFDRQPVEEKIAENGQTAGAVGISWAAAKNGLPDFCLAEILQHRLKGCRHLLPQTFRTCAGLMLCNLSTSSSPSAVSEIAKCGSGRGAGPSIFSPSALNLLPWHGHAIMSASGFHCVTQPRWVQTADTA